MGEKVLGLEHRYIIAKGNSFKWYSSISVVNEFLHPLKIQIGTNTKITLA